MPFPRVFRARLPAAFLGLALAAPAGMALQPGALLLAAAAATTPPALTIVSSSTWRESGRPPTLHVVGEVANVDATETAENIQLDCRLTSAGVLVAEETLAADAAVLQPGEKSPFDVLFLAPPSYDSYTCSPRSAPTVVQPDHNFAAQIDTVSGDPAAGGQQITGSVLNQNTVAVQSAQLFFTFYANGSDVPRHTVAEDRLWLNFANPIPAGTSTPFTLLRYGPAWNGSADALLAEAPTPAVTLSPNSVSLSAAKTTTRTAAPISLTNTGTSDLHIGTLTLGGPHPADWSEVDTCAGATIVSLGSCSITVSFTPSDVGDRSATLTVVDDANKNPHTITLTGTGTNPQAVPSPSPLAFGPQVVGSTSASQSLTINNPGVGDLHVASVSVSGPNATDFTVVSDACSGATVHQGAGCAVMVTFHPAALGTQAATVTIQDDALDNPQTVSATGSGVQSTVSFDALTYDFGNHQVGSSSAPTTITITNRGTTTLTVSNVCVGNPKEFAIGPDVCAPGFSLDPGKSKGIATTFSPAKTGTRTSRLTFVDNAPDSPQQVTLTGNGTFGGQYHPLTPARIYDTRNGAGALGAGLQGSPLRVVPIGGTGGSVPANATAVVMNVTVTHTTAASFLTVYPTGAMRPTASNLNWVAGQTVPNLVEVGLGAGGSVSVFNAAGSADVIFDLAGYVTPAVDSPGPGGFFNPLPPARVLDTRNAIGVPAARVASGQQVDLQLTGAGGVPTTGVAAVVLNVTVANPSAAGFLTVYPTGDTRPNASNLNFVAGQTVPNRVIVKVGANGRVSFYNASGQVDVIADVGGWFSDSSASGIGAGFNPLPPTRILDTRDGTGGFQARLGQTPIALTVTNVAGIPDLGSATPPAAVVLNVTVANPSAASYLSLWPGQTTQPTASDLNFAAGQTVPNLVVVKVGADGKIDIFNAAGTADVIVDVVGWYS